MNGIIGTLATSLHHLPPVLMHTLWQGALLALMVAVLLRRIPATRPTVRYGVAAVGFMGLVVAALITWCVLIQQEQRATPASAESSIASQQTNSTSPPQTAATTPTPVAAPPPAVNSVPTQPAMPSLPNVLLWIWAIGVALMLTRVAALLRGTRTLYRSCRRPDAPGLSALLEEMKTVVGVSRRVALFVTDDIVSPVAVGLLFPAILFPVSMVTHLSPDQLRAVLAHELAHIRRYDYLVNFLQLIVEAFLYFNPAMWWLSRQLRIEREACCDAIAAQAMTDPLAYAGLLTDVARAFHASGNLALAGEPFAGTQGSGSLLDRIRRLLLPGYRPALRLRWYSLAIGLMLTLALLLGLYKGSALGVGWVLTDKERIALIEQLDKEYPGPRHLLNADEEKFQISGTVVPFDGKPLGPPYGLMVNLKSPTQHLGSSMCMTGNTFTEKLPAGTIYIDAVFPGYAPTRNGPFKHSKNEPLSNIEIPIGPSHPATVRLVDPQGNPIAAASVTGHYLFAATGAASCFNAAADTNGCVRLDQADPPVTVSLTVKADGFHSVTDMELLLKPNTTFDLKLQQDTPLEGVVVDRDSGKPISGAEVFDGKNLSNPALGKSDEAGHFALRGLDEISVYKLLVRAAGYGSQQFNVAPGELSPIRIALYPRSIRGVLKGDLGLLEQAEDGSGPFISGAICPQVCHSDGMIHLTDLSSRVTVDNGLGYFEFRDLDVGVLYIKAGPLEKRVSIGDENADVLIELAQAQTMHSDRRLILRFPGPDGAPPAQGTVTLTRTNNAERYQNLNTQITVGNGQGETTVEVPAKVNLYVEGLSGYIARPVAPSSRNSLYEGWSVPEGTEPYVIEVPLDRAGAIHGQVLNADGTPASGALVWGTAINLPNLSWPSDYRLLGTPNRNADDKGVFVIAPIPIEGSFTVSAGDGLITAEETVTLTRMRTIREVTLRLPRGQDVAVQVLKPNGEPAGGIPITTWVPGHSWSGQNTDSNGRVLLHGVDSSVHYTVQAQPPALYQYASIPLSLDEGANVIHLQDGLKLQGVLRMTGTQKPVPNHTVRGSRPSTQYDVTTVTDGEGKFQFSNLSPGEFVLYPEGTMELSGVGPDNERTFPAGRTDAVTLYLEPRTQTN